MLKNLASTSCGLEKVCGERGGTVDGWVLAGTWARGEGFRMRKNGKREEIWMREKSHRRTNDVVPCLSIDVLVVLCVEAQRAFGYEEGLVVLDEQVF